MKKWSKRLCGYFQQPTCCQQLGGQKIFYGKNYVNPIGSQSAWNLWNLFRRSVTGNVIARPIFQLHDRSITSSADLVAVSAISASFSLAFIAASSTTGPVNTGGPVEWRRPLFFSEKFSTLNFSSLEIATFCHRFLSRPAEPFGSQFSERKFVDSVRCAPCKQNIPLMSGHRWINSLLYAETARPNRIKKPVAVINDSLCGIQFVDNKREFFVPDRKRLGQLEAIVYYCLHHNRENIRHGERTE